MPSAAPFAIDATRRRGSDTIVAAVASTGTAIVTTWPLATRLVDAVPLGTEREATVPLFNLWQLWWTADRVAHGFAGYLDAPIFWPNQGVTTYTEAMPLLGIMLAPLWAIHLPPALIYNLGLLAMLVGNGLFAYRLASALGASRRAAIATAVLAVNLPYGFKVLGVLPSIAFFGMFATIEGFVRFSKVGAARWAGYASLGFAATFLTWQQNALFFVPVAVSAGIAALHAQSFRSAAAKRVIVPAAIVAAVVGALALPVLARHDQLGFDRPEPLVKALSARPADFFTRPADTLFDLPHSDPADTAGLYPGIVLTSLAAAGAYGRWRVPADRRWVAVLGVGVVAGALIAIGLNLEVFGWRPYATLRAIPGVATVRSPYRAAAVLQVCLVPLAALGLDVVARPARRRAATALVVAVVAFSVVENATVTPLTEVPASARTEWSEWLRDQSEGTVIAHVPFPTGGTAAAFEVETRRMFWQIDHRQPMVNGYSGFFPSARAPDGEIVQVYLGFAAKMAQEFPTEFLACILVENLGVKLLIVDDEWAAAHRDGLATISAFLTPAFDGGGVRIYRIGAPAGACAPQRTPEVNRGSD